MNQYQNQYGTVYAVRDYKGAPQIMCRAKDDGDWLVSGTLAAQAAAAKTADEMQSVLDQHATAHGWQPVDEQAPASAEPPEIVDEGSGPESGFPDWVRPMVEAFLRFPFFRELPAFTAFALRHSEPVQHRQGGSLADGLYDTVSKGIKFSVFRGDNSDQYREAHYTWADFVRRCKAAGLAPEQLHQDKEDAPCNTETPAQTGAAAATTDASAAPEPSQAAETLNASPAKEGDANSSRSAEPAPQAPAASPLSAPDTAPMSLPAFDYTGLDAQTAKRLQNLARRANEAKQRYILDMMEIVVEAHRELCGVVQPLDNSKHGHRGEAAFTNWCASIGVGRSTAYNLLQVQALMDGSTPEEQAALAEAPAKLLYAAAKPSAPAELVQAVKDGDITTHKQYQDLLAQYDAEKAARAKAEKAAKAMTECYNTAHKNEEFTLKNMKKAQAERDTALRRAAEAEKQRDGARDALAAAKLRGDKWQAEAEALKAQPVEAQVVDEEEIDRRAKERADELTAPLREELEALRARHPADPEEAEQAIRDAYDSAVYTGRVIESAWRSLCPLLPRMDADRRELALNQIVKIISAIQGECIKCL